MMCAVTQVLLKGPPVQHCMNFERLNRGGPELSLFPNQQNRKTWLITFISDLDNRVIRAHAVIMCAESTER